MAAATLWGCTTPPKGVAPSEREGGDFFSTEDRRFLETVTTLGVGGEGELFFTFDRWAEGRSRLERLVPEASTSMQKVRRLWAGISPDRTVVVLHVDASRFLSSIALNSRGWDRIDWGLWRNPRTGTTVSFLPDRLWLVTAGASVSTREELPRLPVLIDEFSLEGADREERRPAVGIGYFPVFPIEGIPQQITPHEFRFLIFQNESVVMRLSFRDEFLARIALVPLRLRGAVLAEALGFVIDDDFDILREGSTITMGGVSLGDVSDLLRLAPVTF